MPATIWNSAKDTIELDSEELESLFCQKAAPIKEKSEEFKKETKQIINLLETKRANHVGKYSSILYFIELKI